MEVIDTNEPPPMPDDAPEPQGPHANLNFQCPDAFQGISQLQLTPDQIAALNEPIDQMVLDILPTGEVYPSQVEIRRQLNRVFGQGKWAIMPRGPFIKSDDCLFREYALFVNGCYVGEATGGQDWYEKNNRQTYDVVCESVKSNALKRCCKDLGIASECWDKRWCEQWKREHAVRVQVKKKDQTLGWQWRRTDADPFPYEIQGSASNPAMEPQRKSQPAQQAAPSPAPAPTADGKPYVSGMMQRDVYEKATNNGGKRFAIQVDGQWYATFDTKVAEVGRAAFKAGMPVSIQYHDTQYGHDIDAIAIGEVTPATDKAPF